MRLCRTCQWCDLTEPSCRRHAPHVSDVEFAMMTAVSIDLAMRDTSESAYKAVKEKVKDAQIVAWPRINPDMDWCGEWEKRE